MDLAGATAAAESDIFFVSGGCVGFHRSHHWTNHSNCHNVNDKLNVSSRRSQLNSIHHPHPPICLDSVQHDRYHTRLPLYNYLHHYHICHFIQFHRRRRQQLNLIALVDAVLQLHFMAAFFLQRYFPFTSPQHWPFR